ncbi:Spy/CpxP family protein refolding chaperone [Stakelama marina]|uniref:Spy/CpxP family protein refolding chaperone n=1 Tax=Stakelama marina TaxID=2826939 RepID=UPI0024C37A38|nr:periplasmic heavy metal sensor [Stakelama marina]
MRRVGLVFLMLLAVALGALGALAVDRWVPTHSTATGLHSFVHERLQLSPDQEAALETLEARFGARQRALDLQLQQANVDLARAIEIEGRNGPRVKAAVATVHARMGALQDATIDHLFAMRALLTPAQRERFDARVTQSLTSQPE